MSRSAAPPDPAPAIRAPLNYLAEGSAAPVFHASAGGAETTRYGGTLDPREVGIRDGRAVPGGFDLDREGFVLLDAPSAVADFYDPGEVARVYDPEVERLVREVTGAARAVVFDHTLRADSVATREERRTRDPARAVHNDYTDRSAPQRVRDILPAEADDLLTRRFAILSVWRPIREPVLTAPLALCDARSVRPDDLVASERRAKGRIGEIFQARFNPAHRWVTFPRMRRAEVLLIKTYDSARDGRARAALHTAFDDPATPPDAPPRESIEARCFAFF